MATLQMNSAITPTKAQLHEFHQQQLRAGLAFDARQSEIVDVLGGIDQVLQSVLQSGVDLEPNQASAIQQILLNVMRDDIRHHARGIRDTSSEEPRQLHRMSPEQPAPDQKVALQEESSRLVAAIEALPILEQRLIRLRLWDGRSWREIAARTGRSRRTLRRSMDEVMRQLANAVA